jgi:hypothetical protein
MLVFWNKIARASAIAIAIAIAITNIFYSIPALAYHIDIPGHYCDAIL